MIRFKCKHRADGRLLACAVLSLAVALGATGCEVPQAPSSAEDESGLPEPVYVKENSKEHRKLQAARAAAEQQPAAGTSEAVATADGAETPDDGAADAGDTGGKVVAAEAGAGKRTPLAAGFITTSINAYFSVRERMAFNQVVRGLKLFHATEGRKPKDFDEVMAEIIKPRAVRLPELKQGDKYIYDPDEGPDGAIMILKQQ